MPCAAAEGVAKRFLTRCSRCLNGAANYVCLACWMGVAAAAKSYISKKQAHSNPSSILCWRRSSASTLVC